MYLTGALNAYHFFLNFSCSTSVLCMFIHLHMFSALDQCAHNLHLVWLEKNCSRVLE